MTQKAWYKQYAQLNDEVIRLKADFLLRCDELRVDPNVATLEIWREVVARAVHESNWQEGIFVDRGRTEELAYHVFDELDRISGPHVDMNTVVAEHKGRIIRLKKGGASLDEIATANLSVAHAAVSWIGNELCTRQTAALIFALQNIKNAVEKHDLPAFEDETIKRGFQTVDALLASTYEITAPVTGGVNTEGDVLQQLLHLDFNDLLHPMNEDYLNFLHRLVLMGITRADSCGKYRRVSVHVGNPDIFFPPASMVPGLMKEFCSSFPTILPKTVQYDPILMAAKTSHRFVQIHPYKDGNGRVSRLIMNLVLWGHHPPVYLKADGKGRHRYSEALKRADRGNLEPLACLIAMSLAEIYEKLAVTIGTSTRRN